MWVLETSYRDGVPALPLTGWVIVGNWVFLNFRFMLCRPGTLILPVLKD